MGDVTRRLSDAADVADTLECVTSADVVPSPDGDSQRLEVVVPGDAVPPELLIVLGEFGLSIDVDATATRADPTKAVVIAR